MLENIANIFEKYIAENTYSGSLLIASKGNLLYKKAHGYSNSCTKTNLEYDSRFIIASLTKTFTAVSILKLLEDGMLDLKECVGLYINDVPKQLSSITIENLM